jgi:hypothetical protein
VKIYLFCFIFLVTAAKSVSAFDIRLTGLEAELGLKPEFNRTFYYSVGTSLSGTLELNNCFTFGAGFSLEAGGFATGDITQAYNVFGRSGFRFPLPFPLELEFSYIYNGIPDYRTNMHTMLPLLSSRWKWAGLSLGMALRYTAFGREKPLSEMFPAVLLFVNFVNREKLLAGLRISNFDDFLAGNLSSYFLNLNVSIKIRKRLYLFSEFELYQTGSMGLSATFYGAAYRGGIKYQW